MFTTLSDVCLFAKLFWKRALLSIIKYSTKTLRVPGHYETEGTFCVLHPRYVKMLLNGWKTALLVFLKRQYVGPGLASDRQ